MVLGFEHLQIIGAGRRFGAHRDVVAGIDREHAVSPVPLVAVVTFITPNAGNSKSNLRRLCLRLRFTRLSAWPPFYRGAKKRLVAIIRGWGQAVQYSICIAARLWNLRATSLWNNHIWFIWNRVNMGRYRFRLVVLRSGFKIDGEMGWF